MSLFVWFTYIGHRGIFHYTQLGAESKVDVEDSLYRFGSEFWICQDVWKVSVLWKNNNLSIRNAYEDFRNVRK